MIGDYNSFETCVQSESDNRNTSLKERIQSLLNGEIKPAITNSEPTITKEVAKNTSSESSTAPNDDKTKENKTVSSNTRTTGKQDYRLTTDMIRNNEIDPMIGMEGIKP